MPYDFSVTPTKTFIHTPTRWRPEPIGVYNVQASDDLWKEIPEALRALVPAAVLDNPNGVPLLRVKSELIEYLSCGGKRTEEVFRYVPLCLLEGFIEGYNWNDRLPLLSAQGIAGLAAAFNLTVNGNYDETPA